MTMVYTKEDGTYGFSWKIQYDFLLRKHPDSLEEIAQARFEALAEEKPEEAAYYRDLSVRLREKMDMAAEDNPEFGIAESDDVTRQFVKEQNLAHLFEEVPGLSGESDETDLSLPDDEVDLSFLDEEFEGIAFTEYWKS